MKNMFIVVVFVIGLMGSSVLGQSRYISSAHRPVIYARYSPPVYVGRPVYISYPAWPIFTYCSPPVRYLPTYNPVPIYYPYGYYSGGSIFVGPSPAHLSPGRCEPNRPSGSIFNRR